MKKVCSSCEKEFSTTIRDGDRTIYSVDRTRCLDCFPYKMRGTEYTDKKLNLKNIQLKCRYGIDLKQYEKLLQEQGGLCAICGSPPPNSYKKRLSVDHDHKTGEIRGLLCTKCNVTLGWLEKNRINIDHYIQQQSRLNING